MGYYCKAMVECADSIYPRFTQLFDTLKENGTPFTPDKVVECISSGSHIMIWSMAKWSDNFPEIQALEKLMDDLDELDEKTVERDWYHYIRSGEDIEDVEERYNTRFNSKGDVYLTTKFAETDNEGEEIIF